MNDFLLYFKLGLTHVLDFKAYDHILFLLVLVVPYTAKQWKELLYLVSIFTVGHTLTLALAAYKILEVNVGLIEFLIPFTIFVTALLNIFFGLNSKASTKLKMVCTFCFGWVHGLGFSYYLQMLLADTDSKLIPLVEFALGIEGAQVLIAVVMLLLFALLHLIFKVTKRDWILVCSAIVVGIVIPMMEERFDAFLKIITS
ncbi:HupE/UreJ family protein [Flavicella sediminum]|uniref:HupE/UreJ family protein n=1 Tax=Flavicella sediminum TaxID=2585141 RepID=UPI00111FF981|nr:HupE/UreJ family protein [Flavicella sediminum]